MNRSEIIDVIACDAEIPRDEAVKALDGFMLAISGGSVMELKINNDFEGYRNHLVGTKRNKSDRKRNRANRWR